LSVYLDANVLVSLFADDSFTERARNLAAASRSPLIVSDFAAAEFVSALGVRCRTGSNTIESAKAALVSFDEWRNRFAVATSVLATDIQAADAFLRRLDLNPRTPDAIHIGAFGRFPPAPDPSHVPMPEMAGASARVVGGAGGHAGAVLGDARA
jgi:uncharacterized protein